MKDQIQTVLITCQIFIFFIVKFLLVGKVEDRLVGGLGLLIHMLDGEGDGPDPVIGVPVEPAS